MLMILARLVRSESFWAVVKVRSPHTGPEVCYIILCNTYDVFAFMSQQTVQRCRCRIGAMSYALRIRIMHHSAAPARGRAMDYALRVSVLCIKRRKPAGEGYVLRITYPYYVSSAESPPERAMYYLSLIHI